MHSVIQGILAASAMLWQMFWALALGFALSGAIAAFVSREKMVRFLGGAGPKSLSWAVFFGSISSSCSFAAASMARGLFAKGAHIVAALAFMLASTNMVIELSAVLWLMLGWQFVLAEIFGGILMIIIMAVFMRSFAPLSRFEKLRSEIEKSNAVLGVAADFRTLEGWKIAGQVFCSETRMIWKDIALGVLISGFAMVLIPANFWQVLFLSASEHSFWVILENAAVAPLVAMLTFVCSVGNIPLAHLLFSRGVSFAGVISFIYADLIIIPLLLIYRKYYGTRLALWIFSGFYLAMVSSGVIVELIFASLGWIPDRPAVVEMDMATFNKGYTFWLNLTMLLISLILFKLGRKKSGAPDSHSCCH